MLHFPLHAKFLPHQSHCAQFNCERDENPNHVSLFFWVYFWETSDFFAVPLFVENKQIFFSKVYHLRW